MMKRRSELENHIANLRLRPTRQAHEKNLSGLLIAVPDRRQRRQTLCIAAALLVVVALTAAFLVTRRPRPRLESEALTVSAVSENALTLRSLKRALAQGGLEGLDQQISQARRRSSHRPKLPPIDSVLRDIEF